MAGRTLVDEIITLIQSEANNNPAPKVCKIVSNYGAKPYSDVEVEELGKLTYIRTIGSTRVGLEGLICFLNGDLNQGVVITSEEIHFNEKLGLNQESSDKFNFAIINKSDKYITYEEFWILSNAYYDYDAKRFVKIDDTHTSFGIQIQANGSYPGEADLGYFDNVGINIWRNPKKSDVFKDTNSYNYTDFDTKNYIGAKRLSDNVWVEYGISSGWSNSFMVDSYGGMTIGGAGFEVDGNGIFPYTRLTSSAYTDSNGDNYYLLGLLDNAYHPTLYGWDCDSNAAYSWFIGLKTPEKSYLIKNNALTKFVIMYNDTPPDPEKPHFIDISRWKTIFEIDINSINGLIGGELKELGDYNSLKNKPNIPSKLSDLDNDMGFLTSHQDLSEYVKNTNLTSILQDYIKNSDLTSILQGYVSNTNLTNVLQDYVETSDLNSTLQNYVNNTSLSTILQDYVTSSDANNNYAPKNHSHDELTDSGWINLSLTGNFYNFDNANRVQYRKVGKNVHITGLPVLNAYPSALTELIIGTLPVDYRPIRNISFLCELKNDAKLWTCTVKSNGDVTFDRLRDNSGFVAGTAFADVLKLNVNFLIN